MKSKGKIYLIPTPLGENDPLEVLPVTVKKVIENLSYFIVENEKTARRFIKKICPEKEQSILHFQLIDKHTAQTDTWHYLDICIDGIDVGILSEAGMPAIADPGSIIVKRAHELDLQVVPLVGPSSILLALMSSGMNGQNFAFNGYLPIDESEKRKFIKLLEKKSSDLKQAQLFIETPFRNNKLFDSLLQTLHPDTKLCIAADITLPEEYIKTLSVSEWKKIKPELHKRPAIFIIQK